jgi:hypothetical protein
VDVDRFMHWYLSNHKTERTIGREGRRKEENQSNAKLSVLSANPDCVAADNVVRCEGGGVVFIYPEFISMSCDEQLCFTARGNPKLSRLYMAICLVQLPNILQRS